MSGRWLSSAEAQRNSKRARIPPGPWLIEGVHPPRDRALFTAAVLAGVIVGARADVALAGRVARVAFVSAALIHSGAGGHAGRFGRFLRRAGSDIAFTRRAGRRLGLR